MRMFRYGTCHSGDCSFGAFGGIRFLWSLTLGVCELAGFLPHLCEMRDTRICGATVQRSLEANVCDAWDSIACTVSAA